MGRAVRWAVENRKGFIERLKATGYFFPERVEEMLEEAAFAALPDPGEEEEARVELPEGLVRALIGEITVLKNGVDVQLRDGTVIEG